MIIFTRAGHAEFFEPVGTPAPNVTPLLAGEALEPASAGPAADSSSPLDEPSWWSSPWSWCGQEAMCSFSAAHCIMGMVKR